MVYVECVEWLCISALRWSLHTFCSSVLLSSIPLFDWWKWFLVDINTMEQFTVVKISTLSFIIHMCVSCFDFRFSLYLFGRRTLTQPLTHRRTCVCERVSSRACVRIKALHTSKNQSHKLSPLRKWNIYMCYYTHTHTHRWNTEGAHGERYWNVKKEQPRRRRRNENASSNRSWKVNCKREGERETCQANNE